MIINKMHDASNQMIGYLYQMRQALNLILNEDDPQAEIYLEKFDDISIHKKIVDVDLIQVKHHKNKQSISDSSNDLWRTINSWIDILISNKFNFNKTKFVIITTAYVSDNSICKDIIDKIESNNIYTKLKHIAEKSTNKGNEKYYTKFLEQDHLNILKIIENMEILHSSNDIQNLEKSIKKTIRYVCDPLYIDNVFERLEGWWKKQVIEALSSDIPIKIIQSDVNKVILNIGNEYSVENLPITEPTITKQEAENLYNANDTYIRQLNLIQIKEKRILQAIQDYHRAYSQRSEWLKGLHLEISELERYENKVLDEWERAFSRDEEEASDENSKVQLGRNLYQEMCSKDIKIRKQVDDSFVLRGLLHKISDDLKCGWHVDFYERLNDAIKKE